MGIDWTEEIMVVWWRVDGDGEETGERVVTGNNATNHTITQTHCKSIISSLRATKTPTTKLYSKR